MVCMGLLLFVEAVKKPFERTKGDAFFFFRALLQFL